MIKAFENLEVWFVTGAQLLYGGETVKIVDGHSKDMVDGLNNSGIIPIKVVYKGTANSSAEVEAVMKAANNDEKCVGIITWMHTFSPAKMWIKGLQALEKMFAKKYPHDRFKTLPLLVDLGLTLRPSWLPILRTATLRVPSKVTLALN